jgi:hypothetical protein
MLRVYHSQAGVGKPVPRAKDPETEATAQSGSPGQRDLIAAILLGMIERLVRPIHRISQRIGFGQYRQSETRGHLLIRTQFGMGKESQRITDMLRQKLCRFDGYPMGQYGKFLAAGARHLTIFLTQARHSFCYSLQKLVARRMTLLVVDPLEMVDVEKDDGSYIYRVLSMVRTRFEQRFQAPSVQQAGQRIPIGLAVKVQNHIVHGGE